jgi:hypothetical protein
MILYSPERPQHRKRAVLQEAGVCRRPQLVPLCMAVLGREFSYELLYALTTIEEATLQHELT